MNDKKLSAPMHRSTSPSSKVWETKVLLRGGPRAAGAGPVHDPDDDGAVSGLENAVGRRARLHGGHAGDEAPSKDAGAVRLRRAIDHGAAADINKEIGARVSVWGRRAADRRFMILSTEGRGWGVAG